ncbi:MAG TPA: hypothetical protein VLG28_11775 [Acidimicrobiia bacterium]|jgi:hypothetical protein|nr:hypothetical protein [Acidimicrobiia bacterium]
MQRRTTVGFLILVLVLALIAAACSGDDDGEGTTTTAAEETVTSLGAASDDTGDASTDDTAPADTTTTSVVGGGDEVDGVAVPTFSIVSRDEGEDGDVVVVLLDTESYDTLTDIDLQNVVSEVVDDFPPVYEAHVVDSEDVTALVVADPADVDADGERLLDLHYLVRLEEGFRIVFVGPFEDSGTAILGS